MKNVYFYLVLIFILSCSPKKNNSGSEEQIQENQPKKTYRTVGLIERLHPKMGDLFGESAQIEVIGEGFTWSEGPVWSSELNALLFSDVKENKIYKWTEEDGVSVYLQPSGFTGDSTDSREKGSNGLSIDPSGHLVLCQHGDRRIARMLSTLNNPKSNFEIVADEFDKKRLNSPNDLTFDKKGNLYFTDPPYGLSEEMLNDPKKELPFQGVYKFSYDGILSLLTDELNYPNGLALSSDNNTLYVSNSEKGNAVWMKYDIQDDGTLSEGSSFYNVDYLIGQEKGFPDGITIHSSGSIFTAGPGGIWIFEEDGIVLGKIRWNEVMSNCVFDENEENLYITADDYLLRVKMK